MSTKTTIIDVRTPQEFFGGNAPGSINIPLNEIRERIDEIKSLQPIIFCCASGNRSGQACRYMATQGFGKLYNLKGGMLAWAVTDFE